MMENLILNVYDLYDEDLKTLGRYIKDNLNKSKDILFTWMEILSMLKYKLLLYSSKYLSNTNK